MGMTINEHIAQLKKLKSFHNGSYGVSINFAIDIMRKYQMFQDQSLSLYMERLKADRVAMLTDIQAEFKEGLRCKGCCNNCVNACEDIPAGWFLDFIDAKINSLKESTDGME